MKTTISTVLILLAAGFFTAAQAQVTAVMQARVNIVSGAGLSAIEEPVIDLSSTNTIMNDDIETGSFLLTVAPGSDLSIHIANTTKLENEIGGIIELESLFVDHRSNSSGEHNVSIAGKVKNQHSLKGNYKGGVTTVIQYL